MGFISLYWLEMLFFFWTAFVIVGVVCLASYRNRPLSIALERIRNTVHDYLTARDDIDPCESFRRYDPKLDVNQEFLWLLEQVARVFEVPSTKLRPSDLLGDLFYGTVKEGCVADARYVEFYDDLDWKVFRLVKRSAWRDAHSSVFFLSTGEDAVLDLLSKMTIAELIKRLQGNCGKRTWTC